MNLTGQHAYQKGKPRKKRSRNANAAEVRQWHRILTLGCIVAGSVSEVGFECHGRITLHHCGTGAGGRRDHTKVIPLCWEHHIGAKGVDGKRMSKKGWQEKYGSEAVLLKRVERRLKNDE